VRALLIAALIASTPPARADEAPRAITFDEAIAASGKTPARRATQDDVAAADALVDAAAAWPSPAIHVQTNRLTARVVGGLTLPLPVFGTVRAARGRARADAEVTRADAVVTSRELRYRAAVAWIALARADAQVETTTVARGQAAQLEQIAQGRLAAGAGAQVDVTIARAELARAELAEQVAVRTQRAAAADLAGLLAWDPARRLVTSGPLPLPVGAAPSLASLREHLPRHPSHLAGARRVVASEASIAEARVQRWPTLALETQVSAKDPTTPGTDVLVGVALELPIFAKVGARVRAERARAAAARARLAASDTQLDAALVAAYDRWQSAIDTLASLERDILPAQERAATLSAEAYQEGARDLATALQASRDLAAVRAEVASARADAASAWVELQNAAGEDFGGTNAR
jgi:outer membrane protein TolC